VAEKIGLAMPHVSITAELPPWFHSTVAAMLACDNHAPIVTQLKGGANNRVYQVQHGRASSVVKWYFTDPEDSRDRFRAEWGFLQFAQRHGIDEPPQPIAADSTNRLAAFEFITGQKPIAGSIQDNHVRAAIDFLVKLNRHRGAPDARDLPAGSEACFSIEQHLACIKERVERLQQESIAETFSDATARRIARVQQELRAVSERVEEQIQNQVTDFDWSLESELPLTEQIISPSDFGFHNALIQSDNRVRFIDFEYAGWDDPAKTICDFFCQLAIPVPMSYWDSFCNAINEIGSDDACPRAELLLPLYRLKWCCIVLNPLLRVGRNRRTFSGQDAESETYIAENCLTKAETLLSQLGSELDQR
jgi:hypothetical protein